MKILKLKKSGRLCYPFPWESKQAVCPWNTATYTRVVIPFSESERRNSKKKSHIQIVANHKLETVRESRLTVQ